MHYSFHKLAKAKVKQHGSALRLGSRSWWPWLPRQLPTSWAQQNTAAPAASRTQGRLSICMYSIHKTTLTQVFLTYEK